MPWWGTRFNYNFRLFNPGQWILGTVLLPVVLWSLFWKGMALYRAARNGQKWWFVILLIVNTVGILEIVYLLFFSKPAPIVKTEGSVAPVKPVTSIKTNSRKKS
jgi:hypothetical protein